MALAAVLAGAGNGNIAVVWYIGDISEPNKYLEGWE